MKFSIIYKQSLQYTKYMDCRPACPIISYCPPNFRRVIYPFYISTFDLYKLLGPSILSLQQHLFSSLSLSLSLSVSLRLSIYLTHTNISMWSHVKSSSY